MDELPADSIVTSLKHMQVVSVSEAGLLFMSVTEVLFQYVNGKPAGETCRSPF